MAYRSLLRGRALQACILALTLALAACGGADSSSRASETQAPPASAPPEPSAPTASDTPTAADAVTLITPGEQPRTELRYDFADDQPIAATMRQRQSLAQTIDGQAGPGVEYTVGFDFRGDVQTEGDTFTSRVTIENARLINGTDPSIEQQLGQAISQLNGVTTVTTTDDRGQILDSSVENTESLESEPFSMSMIESLVDRSNISVPLPREPVGVGARWSSMQEINSGGIVIRQTTESELLSLEGSVAELAVTATQEAPDGPVTIQDGLPGEVEVDINAWDATSEGTMRLDLTEPMPTSQVHGSAHQEMTTTAEGQSATLEQDLTTDIELSPN